MLRILDFNVWSGLTYLGYLKMGTYGDASFLEKRRSVMLELIRQLDPDIVCLHELNPLPRAGQSIATELGMDSFYHLHLG
ncbi:MAG: hypothetical protein K8R21_03725, partial [Leptospira sp.]|nr:hypothetical protein [Leptospira sp.]